MEILLLRDFQKKDFAEIESLWQDTGVGSSHRGDDLDCVERTLKRGGRLLVAEIDGKIVSTCWLSYDGRRLMLHHMAVNSAYQRRGLGRKMLRESMEYARQLNAQLKLEVDKTNPGAIELYSKGGLKVLEQFQIMTLRNP
jgi:ribosomal protein S18 acetylase RimI-like enzyme